MDSVMVAWLIDFLDRLSQILLHHRWTQISKARCTSSLFTNPIETIAIYRLCYCIYHHKKKMKLSRWAHQLVDWFLDNQFIVVIMIQWNYIPGCTLGCLYTTLLVWSVLITQIKGSNPDILAFIWCWHFFSFRSHEIRIQFSRIYTKNIASYNSDIKLALFWCLKNYKLCILSLFQFFWQFF